MPSSREFARDDVMLLAMFARDLTELLFGLAELFGVCRVDVRGRRQRTLRAAGLSKKRERRESGDSHANGPGMWHITLREATF